MLTVILLVYGLLFALYAPNLFIYKINWRSDPETNRSVASLIENRALASVFPIVGGILFILKPVSIFAVIIGSSISIDKLKKATKKRRAMRESQSAASQSETRVTKMLLFLCVTYVVCVLPDVAGAFTTYFVPQFFFYRKHHNLFVVCFEVFFVASCLNSTVNVFAYMALSSRFRATVGEMIPGFARLFVVKRRSVGKRGRSSGTVLQSSETTISVVS